MSRPGHAKNLTDLFAKPPVSDPGTDHPVVSVVSSSHNGDIDITAKKNSRPTNGVMAYPLQQIRILTGWPTGLSPLEAKPLLVEDAKMTPLTKMRSELLSILRELQFMTAAMKEEDEGNDEMNEWKFAAMVIDRLCLWVFTIYLAVATLAIFFQSPNLQDSVTKQLTGDHSSGL